MNKIIKISAVVSLLTLISGCGGDGSVSEETTGSTSNVAGTAADGYLFGATVCLDQNADGSCTGESIISTTSSGGAYSLTIPAGVDASAYSVVVEVGPGVVDEGEDTSSTDDDTNITDGYTLSSPPGKPEFISPLTTLINNIIQDSTPAEILRVENQLKDQLGISGSSLSLYQDYVSASKTGNDSSQYLNLFRTVQLLARHFATTEKALANIGATKAQIAKATSSLATDQISTIVGVVQSDPTTFNVEDAFAKQLDTWKAKATEITSVDDIKKHIARTKVPKIVSTGIFMLVDKTDSRNDLHIEFNIDFFGLHSDLSDWNIQLLDSNDQLIHSFVEADIDTVYAREGRVGYEKRVTSLDNGTYRFVAVSKQDTSGEVIELASIEYEFNNQSTDPMLDSLTGSEIYYRIDNQYNNLMVSIPQGDIDTHYLGTIWDEDDNYLGASGWRRGRNYFYFDAKHEDNAAYLIVYARDGDSRESTNLIYAHLRQDLTRTSSKVELTHGRAKFHTGNTGTAGKYQQIRFDIDMETPQDQEVPSFTSLVLSKHNGGSYEEVTSCDNTQVGDQATCDDPNAESYPEYFQGDGTGWASHYQSIEFNSVSDPLPGHYLVTVTDTDNNKDQFYLNLGTQDTSSAAAALSIDQLQMDNYPDPVIGLGDFADGWINGSISNPVDGYNYRVDFRVEYEKDGDENELRTASITKTARSPSGDFVYPVALLKSKLSDRIANLIQQGHTPTQLLVRLNVSDGLSSYLENNTWYTNRVPTPYFSELFD